MYYNTPRHGESRYNSTIDEHEYWHETKQCWLPFSKWYELITKEANEKAGFKVCFPHEWVNVGFTTLKLVCKNCDKDKTEEDDLNLADYGIFEEEII